MAHVQRLPADPALERRGRDNVVQFQRQLESILLREERVHVEDAELGEWRLLDLQNNVFQVQAIALLPGILKNICQEHVFTVFNRIGSAAYQGQQRRDDAPDAFAV